VAIQTITRLIDDLDGSDAERTVRFGLDGQVYELDLNTKHISALEKAMKPYLDAARSVQTARRRTSAPKQAAPGSPRRRPRRDLSAIREWARANGHEVTDRGRIPAVVMQAYEAAQ
jgi:hypothetical protein